MDILRNIGIILIIVGVFGVCIFVHELGHLLVALWRGMHVERFSIGFGKVLWSRTRKGVEYVVSILPFGGYVALPQLEPTDTPADKDGNPLPHASPGDRALTALAGPLANIVFGFILAVLVWQVGVYRPAPATECEVIIVPEASPEFAVGLRPGDVVVAVNSQTFTNGWQDLVEKITLHTGMVSLQVRRGNEPMVIRYRPAPNPDVENLGYPFFRVRSPTLIAKAMDNYPAAAAGLQKGDMILSVDGKPVEHAGDFIGMIMKSKGAIVAIQVRRDGRDLEPIRLRPVAEEVDGRTVYRIGAELTDPLVLTHLSPWSQFTQVVDQTYRTLRTLTTRNTLVKPKHMSGPVGIVNVFWYKFAVGGWREGLAFVVFLCFALALVNLLPLPVLDGGHVTFAGIEALIRRRLPTRFMYYLQTGFAVLLITFMVYVTFYDVRRLARHHQAKAKAKPAQVEETQPDTSAATAGETGRAETTVPENK